MTTTTSEDDASASALSQSSKKEGKDATTAAVSMEAPSMTISLVIFWVFPVVIFGLLSRFGHVSMEVPTFRNTKSVPLVIPQPTPQQLQQPGPSLTPTKPLGKQQQPSKMPTSYQEIVRDIQSRRRSANLPDSAAAAAQPTVATTSAASPSLSPQARSLPKEDPSKIDIDAALVAKREEYMNDPTNVFTMIALADTMRQRDILVHDGGTLQSEALKLYENIIIIVKHERRQAMKEGKSTSPSFDINQEIMIPYRQKSQDGLLISMLTAKGKMYYMANMFENSAECYQEALDIEPDYKDALNGNGSVHIILGNFKTAAVSFMRLLELEDERNPVFADVFTGLSRVLSADEDAVEGGWEFLIARMNIILDAEKENETYGNHQHINALTDTLKRVHHAMFTYHDVKTKDTQEAWEHLTKGYQHKMRQMDPWDSDLEKRKVEQVHSIFSSKAFWPDGVGVESRTPIFIVGFPRCGSTLLERILDAHSGIVGTGEDSVFNGRLDSIRNNIVRASGAGSLSALQTAVATDADETITEMRKRWLESIQTNRNDAPPRAHRFTDKMLTNYMNIGFIHLMFPNALILHVARNPMDTVFSCYKHEFPPGTLDHTSNFDSLADLYQGYRDTMDHWESVLPGRITHVRYEDMVEDMPGMAKAIIDATGLEWEDGVLDYHKKKQAVNTLSTVQVRKGIYKHAIEAWKRYEEPLKPLVKRLGAKYVEWNLKTTLPSYKEVMPWDKD